MSKTRGSTPRRITIFGNGLVGASIARILSEKKYIVKSLDSADLDLADSVKTNAFIARLDLDDVLIFSAGLSGGIFFNLNNAYELYSANMRMINNFISAAADRKFKNVLNIVPACVYPANLTERAKVEDLWRGPMEHSSLAYSTAKISGLVGFESVRRQMGLNWTNLIVTNVYGIHKNIDQNKMHVIPALIQKFRNAKSSGEKSVQLLGDGTSVREFLYSSDLGLAVQSFLENDLWSVPTRNIGGSEPISIFDLAKTIADEVGYKGEITVEGGSNNGTSIKLLDDTIFRSAGWKPKVQLRTGINLLKSST